MIRNCAFEIFAIQGCKTILLSVEKLVDYRRYCRMRNVFASALQTWQGVNKRNIIIIKNSHFRLLHPEERVHPSVICELLLARNCKAVVGCLLQNRVGEVDPHISLT
jgi:hypothetical protein